MGVSAAGLQVECVQHGGFFLEGTGMTIVRHAEGDELHVGVTKTNAPTLIHKKSVRDSHQK